MDSGTAEQITRTTRALWLPEVRQGIKCAVIYGSRAVVGADVGPDSDLDVFLVTKQEANPVTIVDSAVRFFAKHGFTCDPFWYVESYFFDALDAGIDCTLWYHVFKLGQIVYGESDLLHRVNAALRKTSPGESFRRTIAARRERDTEHLRALVRNTDRILTEAVLLAYSRAMGLSMWDALPERRSLTSTAVAAGVIDEDIHLIAERLATLRRWHAAGPYEVALAELADLRERVARFVNDQVKD